MMALQTIEKPICNVAAEVAVIGAMLCERQAIETVADTLTMEDFADPFLGGLFSLIVREHSLGRAATPITIRPFLDGDPSFNELGGMAWLADLTGQRLALGAVSSNAGQIIEFAQRRRLIEGLREAIAAAGDFERPIAELIETADTAINAVREPGANLNEFSAAQCIESVINGFNETVTGVECGVIPSIDDLLGPMRPSHLVIGAGRPGMGKTATAISYALGAAAKGHGVLFISLEMAANELGERMAADLCLDQRIPYEAIRDRNLSQIQQRDICRAFSRIEKMPLQIVDRAGMSITQLRTIARRWARRFEARGEKLELVIVDYLQLMRADRKMDRYEAVTEISRSLKELAKELGVAIFALAQLSRAVEQRADKRPMLSDLRESGQIEQDADAVLFFLRDEYYLRLAEPHEEDKRARWEEALQRCLGGIEFICAKRRNGRTGSMTGQFLYHYQAVRG